MEVTLVRNGYNVERRKMYLENPRNNLRSSVDFVWSQSLENHTNPIRKQKDQNFQLIKQSYTKVIDKKLQDQLKLNKSSFRVMMAPEAQKMKANSPRIGNSHYTPSYTDALSRELQHQQDIKKTISFSGGESPIRNHKGQSLSKSVFGYEIDRNAFQKQSYLSKILNDRLQPFLNKKKQNPGETNGLQKHQSFTINHPISLQY